MTCQEVAEFIARYLDGELAPDERLCFEAHLAECPDCVAYLDSYRATIALARLTGSTSPTALAQPIPEELVRAILSARRAADRSKPDRA